MSKRNASSALGTHVHTCARCGAQVIATTPPDGRNTYCPKCFAQNVHQVETWVLEDYCQFGAWARHEATQLFLARYRAVTTVRDRKLLALKIYEEFILAAE